jgi:hypothetical protein
MVVPPSLFVYFMFILRSPHTYIHTYIRTYIHTYAYIRACKYIKLPLSVKQVIYVTKVHKLNTVMVYVTLSCIPLSYCSAILWLSVVSHWLACRMPGGGSRSNNTRGREQHFVVSMLCITDRVTSRLTCFKRYLLETRAAPTTVNSFPFILNCMKGVKNPRWNSTQRLSQMKKRTCCGQPTINAICQVLRASSSIPKSICHTLRITTCSVK